MRSIILALVALAAFGGEAWARGGSVSTRGYTRSNGTYVQPHYRTAPNSTRSDNWSTRGNVNPYTGKAGTRDPYPAPRYGR